MTAVPRPVAKRQLLSPAADLEGVTPKPRTWVVPDMIPAGAVTLLSGDGGVGKSTLALQLAVAVATGTEWLGLKAARGSVVLLSAEDDRDELHRRLIATCAEQAVTLADLTDLYFMAAAGEDLLLAIPETASNAVRPTALYRQFSGEVSHLTPRLVIIDTAADVFGGNENDRAQVRSFLTLLRSLCRLSDTAVLLLAHPSVAAMATGRGVSGSTAWANSCRSLLYLSNRAGNRELNLQKSNYAPVNQRLFLQWQDGVFARTCSNTAQTANAGGVAEHLFLERLRETNQLGRNVNSKGGANYAPNVFAAHAEAGGVTKIAFRQAMDRLLATGEIEEVLEGPPSKRRRHLKEVWK